MSRSPLIGLLALLCLPGDLEAAEAPGLLAIPRHLEEAPDDAATAEGGRAPPSLEEPVPIDAILPHRPLMRDILIQLSTYAKGRNGKFIVLARGGPELLYKGEREARWEELRRQADGEEAPRAVRGTPNESYLAAIDGVVLDGVFCGRHRFDEATPAEERQVLAPVFDILHGREKRLLSIEHCDNPDLVRTAVARAKAAGVASFVSPDEDMGLDAIPKRRPADENADHVTNAAQIGNFLPILDSSAFESRPAWVAGLANTNYDALILDVFDAEGKPLTVSEVRALKHKLLGARRLVLAAMPVGKASSEGFYWRGDWGPNETAWLGERAGDRWIVDYWTVEWKGVLGRYMQGIIDLGFDGVMFDDIETYRLFEARTPLAPDERAEE